MYDIQYEYHASTIFVLIYRYTGMGLGFTIAQAVGLDTTDISMVATLPVPTWAHILFLMLAAAGELTAPSTRIDSDLYLRICTNTDHDFCRILHLEPNCKAP